MANTKTTEGNTEDISAFSDLTLGISLCQSVPNPPMRVGEPWATIGRAANHAGRWTNIPEATLLLPSGQCRRSGGSGVTRWPYHSVKPAIEKEARLRPQHIILFGCCLGNTKGNAAACVLAGHHHSPSRNRIKTGHYIFGSGAGPSNTGSLWRN
jgi:hypothetical protein